MKRWSGILGIGFVLIVLAGFAFLPGLVENAANKRTPHAAWSISDPARKLHEGLAVADLHTDTLGWKRDLLKRATRGHSDIPRILEGNVALQVFGVFTKSPRGQNYEENSADSDNVTALVIAQRWPIRTYTSLLERALYQAEKLRDVERRAPETLRVVRTAADLDAVLKSRADGRPILAGLLASEGGHPLEGDLNNLQKLYDAGFRMLGLHHFFDNALGGSLHGKSDSGLTEFGRSVVRELEARKIIIDVAHSSPASVDDVLEMATRPIVVSHTGMRGACDSPRNLDDARLKRIADRGGLIGIGFWEGAVCDHSPKGVVRSIRHAVNVLGVDHVALGSDYDGATTVLFDISEIAVLTHEMLESGFSSAEIRKIMGGNTLRFLGENLPQ